MRFDFAKALSPNAAPRLEHLSLEVSTVANAIDWRPGIERKPEIPRLHQNANFSPSPRSTRSAVGDWRRIVSDDPNTASILP